MATLTFAFDQLEINKLISDLPASQNILVSIVSAKIGVNSKNNLFLAAQLSKPKSNDADTSKQIAIGCPVPPGWKSPLPVITPDQLNGLPKFFIAAAAKKKLLANNSTVNDGQLFADLEGMSNGTTLQSGLSFRIIDGNNNITNTVLAEVL